MSHTMEWVTNRERFVELSESWDELTRADSTPFGDHAWFLAWFDAFGSDASLRTCVLWRGNDLCAALPLMAQRGRLVSLANYHTPVFSAPSSDRSALQEVVDAAFDAHPSEVMIHAIRVPDPLREAVIGASSRRNRVTLVEDVHRSPLVELEGDFDTYLRGRGSRMKTIRRRWRKLNREHEAEFRFEHAIEDLDAELARGFAVEAAGWKGKKGTAILSTPEATAFYTALAHAYHARGALRLAWLDIDGQPSAFNYCLLRDRRLYCIKRGYDERFRQSTPGLLMELCTIERCFELGLGAYDLLGQDEPYKEYFANANSEHLRIRSYRRRPIPLVRYVTRRLGRPVARALRNRLAR